MLETLLRDLRFALRSLAGRPGFTTAALLTLALGIGANTAMFSLVNALLLRPLPFGTRSERVVTLHSTHPTQARDWQDSRISYSDLEDVKAANRSFEDVAGYVSTAFTLTAADATDAEAVRVQGGSVTPNLFPLLGVQPMLGRQFRPEEAQTFGFAQVALLGHNLWQRRFAGDPDIVGKAVRVNGRSLTIVGVLPRRFKFPERDEMYVPFRPSEPRRDQRFVLGVAVLREGVTLARAREDAAAIAGRLAEQFPDTNRRWGLQVLAIRDLMVNSSVRVVAPTLLGAVGFVLLIGCANLANLLLARGSARQREMAVRTAIGATRFHLVRQMLSESLLLAVAGGFLGALLSEWGLDALVASFPEELPYWVQLDLDGRVLAFSAGLTVLTAFGFGLLPALRASKPDLVGELKDGARGAAASPSQKRLQSALVVGQMALCLALLVGANLMIRSFLELQRADSGFDETRLLSLRLYLAGDVYDPIEAKAAFFRRTVETLHALPGVAQAAATTTIPTDDGGRAVRLVAEGQAAAPGDETGGSLIGTTPALFETLGVSLVEGRTFTEQEAASAAADVGLVNETLARRFWPGTSAVGRRIGLVEAGAIRWLTVVGVAPNVQYEEIGEETEQSRLNLYVPYAHGGWRTMAFLVRTAADPAAVVGSVRTAIRKLDAGNPAYDVRTLREVRAYTTWEQRFFGQTMGAFAAAALLLACLGVYGVLAYGVSRRAHEIGVRMALGARPEDVVRLVVGQGASLALLGVGGGLLLAAGVARMLRGILYGVSAADPWAFAAMAALLSAVVVVASYLPARRAARIDPMAALRCE